MRPCFVIGFSAAIVVTTAATVGAQELIPILTPQERAFQWFQAVLRWGAIPLLVACACALWLRGPSPWGEERRANFWIGAIPVLWLIGLGVVELKQLLSDLHALRGGILILGLIAAGLFLYPRVISDRR